MSRISSDNKYTSYPKDYENEVSRYSGRTSRNERTSTTTNGRESVNSFEDSSVKNSQSGTTDGGISSSRNHNNNTNTNNKNNVNNNNTSNPSYMGSTDTISRSINQRETLHSRFDFIKVLGKGTYGKVKLANDKRTGKQVFKQTF